MFVCSKNIFASNISIENIYFQRKSRCSVSVKTWRYSVKTEYSPNPLKMTETEPKPNIRLCTNQKPYRDSIFEKNPYVPHF